MKLLDSKVLVLGAEGSLTGRALPSLRPGRHAGIIDMDVVEASNYSARFFTL